MMRNKEEQKVHDQIEGTEESPEGTGWIDFNGWDGTSERM